MAGEQLASQAFAAMGTQVEVHADPREITSAVRVVGQVFQDWEATLSRFRSASELSALNRGAGRPFAASELLFRVVSRAIAWAEATEGTFDPSMLRQIERLGYDKTFSELSRTAPGPARAGPLPPGGGWRRIAMEPEGRRITLPPGLGLDLGGIAKGMAVDAALAALEARGVGCALVNAGGDLVVRGLPPGMDGWPVGVKGLDEVIVLREGAVATSGISRRRWRQGGEWRHHLLDPVTGYPVAEHLASVTVVAACCEVADVAATTAFIKGLEAGRSFLAGQALAGLFVTRSGDAVPAGSWLKGRGERWPWSGSG